MNTINSSSSRRRARLMAGYTLIELLVSIVIGLFLLGGLVTLLVTNSVNSSELNKTGALIENGRYAMQLLIEDVQHAGYWGTYSSSPTTSENIPANLCPTAANLLGFQSGPVSIPVPLYGYDGAAATPTCLNAAATTALPNRIAGTDILIVRRVSTTSVAVAAADPAEVYLQVANCVPVITPFVVDYGSAGLFTLQRKGCGALADVQKYMVHIYYVSSCNVCGTDTTPTLNMVEFINGEYKTTPLVEGIEDLQIEYGLDTDQANVNKTGAGSPDCYTSDPTAVPAGEAALCPTAAAYFATATALDNWKNVVSARINLLARNVDPTTGWVDNRQYNLGRGALAVGPKNDSYKRHAFSAVARLYNPAGMREAP